MKGLILVCVLVAVANAAPNSVSLPKLDGRIVGGHPVLIEDHPYQAVLLYFGSHICGAVNLGSRFALTAAHCTDGGQASQFSLRVGSSFAGRDGVIIQIATITQHPNYNSNTIDNDVSVLFTSSELHPDSGINFIQLVPQGTVIPNGIAAFVTGWGTLAEGGALPDQLQGVSVDVVSPADCRAAYGAASITDNMVCAGQPEGGRDACQGDSGGPLTLNEQLIGIVSWGYGCARPSYPGVYASISSLHGWIATITGA